MVIAGKGRKAVRRKISQKWLARVQDTRGRCALHMAVEGGDPMLVRFLCRKAPASIQITDNVSIRAGG